MVTWLRDVSYGHGKSVDMIFLPYAQEIADTEPGQDVPVWS